MNKIALIKVITFDADDTLWDFNKVMRESLQLTWKELARINPEAAARLDIPKMIEIRNRTAAELKGKVTNLEEVRLEAFRQTFREIGCPDDILAAHLNEYYLRHRFDDIELYPDVLPALQKLREKYTLGLVTNGNSYPERCGLDGMFAFTVFSQDHGVEKPDPRFYQIAVEKSGVTREEILHVGDSLENDVIGAARAGIKCVWLNRRGIDRSPDIPIDYEVSSLIELFEML
jgi:2-haloalkanoic acid dehalogenase type II